MTDAERVRIHLDAREMMGDGEMSDAAARVVASWYAGGTGPGAAFASTGAITTPADDVWRDLTEDGRLYASADQETRRALDWLGTYLLNRDERGPVPGWSNIWLR